MRLRYWSFGLILSCLLPVTVGAQDREQTLADIRQELSVLYVEIQKLKREFNTTGSPNVTTGGGTTLDRINSIETELQRLTGQTEQLEFRIGRIVEDGTRRIGDLEFRLVELEGGDLGQLGETTTLGGDAAVAVPTPAPTQTDPVQTPSGNAQLAENEKADFERASSSLANGDFTNAAQQFQDFNLTYPGGPLSVAADLRRGEALDGLGDTREAARAYLEGFRADQQGPLAGEALFRLGRALGQLGQTNEACVTLGEVGIRFPGDAAVLQAQDEMLRIGCG
ncbi:MAG: tetratricopeptide repeat protein [Paracoccaceae bacterium]